MKRKFHVPFLGEEEVVILPSLPDPRTKGKGPSTVRGFRTGDMAKVIISTGTKIGTYVGRVAVRETGSFNITTATGTIQGLNVKYFTPIQRIDGYSYQTAPKERSASRRVVFPPHSSS